MLFFCVFLESQLYTLIDISTNCSLLLWMHIYKYVKYFILLYHIICERLHSSLGCPNLQKIPIWLSAIWNSQWTHCTKNYKEHVLIWRTWYPAPSPPAFAPAFGTALVFLSTTRSEWLAGSDSFWRWTFAYTCQGALRLVWAYLAKTCK